MSVQLDVSEDNLFAALRTFLLSILPASVEVFKAQGNRVPEPKVVDFVVMTPSGRTRLSTNTDVYDKFIKTRRVTQATRFSVQLDVHGPSSGDNSQLITTLFRDLYGTEKFSTENFDISPLYTTDPHQIPFINAEEQFEDRWVIGAELQFNPTVILSQDFSNSLDIAIINVEATYPPQ